MGKISLEKIDFNVMAVVEETMSLFKPIADAKAIDILIENMLAGSSTYQGDPMRLRQILSHLVGNAIAFTNAGRVTVGIEKNQENSDSSVIMFSVTDTGIGVSDEVRETLFQPFTQGSELAAGKLDGTGRGLTTTKQLVELMGGTIGVESEPEKGSTFWFTATFTKRQRRGHSPAAKQPGGARTALRDPNVRYDARILLAEDFRTNQMVAVAILDNLGFATVDIVENGNEVVHAAATGRYDLILMDVQMPGLDGNEATRTIRSSGNTIPIVGLTAYATLSDREKCLDSGMDEYMTKPINRQKLRTLLEKHLAIVKLPVSSRAADRTEASGLPKEEIFNRTELLALLEDDEEKARSIIGEFLTDLPGLFSDLEVFLSNEDGTNASRLAHGIKGAAGSLSCPSLSSCACNLETACSQNDFMAARACMKELHVQYSLVLRVVDGVGMSTLTKFNNQE